MTKSFALNHLQVQAALKNIIANHPSAAGGNRNKSFPSLMTKGCQTDPFPPPTEKETKIICTNNVAVQVNLIEKYHEEKVEDQQVQRIDKETSTNEEEPMDFQGPLSVTVTPELTKSDEKINSIPVTQYETDSSLTSTHSKVVSQLQAPPEIAVSKPLQTPSHVSTTLPLKRPASPDESDKNIPPKKIARVDNDEVNTETDVALSFSLSGSVDVNSTATNAMENSVIDTQQFDIVTNTKANELGQLVSISSNIPEPILPSLDPIPPTSVPIPPNSVPIPPSSVPIPSNSVPIPPTSVPILPSSIPIPPTSVPMLPSSVQKVVSSSTTVSPAPHTLSDLHTSTLLIPAISTISQESTQLDNTVIPQTEYPPISTSVTSVTLTSTPNTSSTVADISLLGSMVPLDSSTTTWQATELMISTPTVLMVSEATSLSIDTQQTSTSSPSIVDMPSILTDATTLSSTQQTSMSNTSLLDMPSLDTSPLSATQQVWTDMPLVVSEGISSLPIATLTSSGPSMPLLVQNDLSKSAIISSTSNTSEQILISSIPTEQNVLGTDTFNSVSNPVESSSSLFQPLDSSINQSHSSLQQSYSSIIPQSYPSNIINPPQAASFLNSSSLLSLPVNFSSSQSNIAGSQPDMLILSSANPPVIPTIPSVAELSSSNPTSCNPPSISTKSLPPIPSIGLTPSSMTTPSLLIPPISSSVQVATLFPFPSISIPVSSTLDLTDKIPSSIVPSLQYPTMPIASSPIHLDSLLPIPLFSSSSTINNDLILPSNPNPQTTSSLSFPEIPGIPSPLFMSPFVPLPSLPVVDSSAPIGTLPTIPLVTSPVIPPLFSLPPPETTTAFESSLPAIHSTPTPAGTPDIVDETTLLAAVTSELGVESIDPSLLNMSDLLSLLPSDDSSLEELNITGGQIPSEMIVLQESIGGGGHLGAEGMLDVSEMNFTQEQLLLDLPPELKDTVQAILESQKDLDIL